MKSWQLELSSESGWIIIRFSTFPESVESNVLVDTLIRAFVCIEIPSTVRDRVERLQLQLADLGVTISWVKKGNFHITLKFLGEISAGQTEDACRVVAEAASRVESFDLELNGIGAFPNQHKPRTLWIGCRATILLEELFKSIEEKFVPLGFPRKPGWPTPHLTIGRIKSLQKTALLVRALEGVEFHSDPFRVQEAILMKSELKGAGAVYSPIQSFPFKRM